jgi:hypothetical protein
MSAETDTSELEMNLRNMLNEKFAGGKKRRGTRKGSKKASKKGSKKMTGGKRRSRKGSKKGSRKGSKKGSRKGSKKGSRKGSKKGSKKQTGGMWGKKTPKKVTGGKRRGSRKVSSKKGSRKASSKKGSRKASSKKGSRKASSRKSSRKGSRARRGLPPAMVAFGKIRAHIMKKLGVKMTVALQIAKKVRDEVMSKHPNVSDHDEIAKKAIEHFNAHESKFSAKAARM